MKYLVFILISLFTFTANAEIRDINIKDINFILFQSEINEESVDIVIKSMDAIPDKIFNNTFYIILSTPGGYMYHYKRLLEYLNTKRNISLLVLKAYSAGAFLVEALPFKRIIDKDGEMMLHFPYVVCNGNLEYNEIKQMYEIQTDNRKNILNMLSDRTGEDIEFFKNKMATDWYIMSDEALKYNLVDEKIRLVCSDKKPINDLERIRECFKYFNKEK